ncbi:hypothetical protein HHK36_032736 [Tetracentron sinense]|uniref:Uncharacterized protein n=1 Tax=Tetracentron sinense TaxID=13715 RepID=A0A834YAE2_TETSI|nr:hypothetical protein HHK36_032736 [Tetracentron sinense]
MGQHSYGQSLEPDKWWVQSLKRVRGPRVKAEFERLAQLEINWLNNSGSNSSKKVSVMDNTGSVAMLIDSTTFEEHFHGLKRSLKKRFNELEEQEKEYESKALESQEMLETREVAILEKEQAFYEVYAETDLIVEEKSSDANDAEDIKEPSKNENMEEQAKDIAEDWKLKLNDLDFDACSGNTLEARAFLQL